MPLSPVIKHKNDRVIKWVYINNDRNFIGIEIVVIKIPRCLCAYEAPVVSGNFKI